MHAIFLLADGASEPRLRPTSSRRGLSGYLRSNAELPVPGRGTTVIGRFRHVQSVQGQRVHPAWRGRRAPSPCPVHHALNLGDGRSWAHVAGRSRLPSTAVASLHAKIAASDPGGCRFGIRDVASQAPACRYIPRNRQAGRGVRSRLVRQLLEYSWKAPGTSLRKGPSGNGFRDRQRASMVGAAGCRRATWLEGGRASRWTSV